MEKLTHFNAAGEATMVDVGDKESTHRMALARGEIRMQPETLNRILAKQIEKGDVLDVARLPVHTHGPAELLGSAMMRQIIEAVRTRFDWVLIDTPPVLAMADASVVLPTVEGVVLVVAGETSSKPQVQRAIEQVRHVGSKVIGVVLNKVNLQRNSYYYTQHYGEYYRSYYTRAGDASATVRSAVSSAWMRRVGSPRSLYASFSPSLAR